MAIFDDSWFEIDLKENRFSPTHYVYRGSVVQNRVPTASPLYDHNKEASYDSSIYPYFVKWDDHKKGGRWFPCTVGQRNL